MDLRLLSAPLARAAKLAVVPVDEVKAQVRIYHSYEDELIADDIEAAYDYLSGPNGWLNGCCLLEEEWEWYVAGPSRHGFELPLRPHVDAAVTSFDVLQSDGTYAAVDPGIFTFVSTATFPLIVRNATRVWPYYGVPETRAYRIRFTAGFGTTKESIPAGIRKSIRLLAAHWYQVREASRADPRVIEVDRQVEFGLVALAGRYRVSPDHS